MIPALLVLHRSAVIRQYQEAAAIDTTNGPDPPPPRGTNATGTEMHASQRSAPGTLGVLMLDVNHFKVINDIRTASS